MTRALACGLLAALAGGPAHGAATGADDAKLEPFLNALEQLQQKYVDESKVDSARLMTKAEEGVVDALDPESLVLAGAAAPAAGLTDPGLVIGVKDGVANILDVLEGSPAAAAGLRAGDRLMRVNGEPAYGKKRLEVERALAGQPGSRVVLLWEDQDGELEEATVDRPAALRARRSSAILRATNFDAAALDWKSRAGTRVCGSGCRCGWGEDMGPGLFGSGGLPLL